MIQPALASAILCLVAGTALAQQTSQPQDKAPGKPDAASPAAAQPAVPPLKRTDSGKSLAVDLAHATGNVYFNISTGARQVSFVSIALNAKFEGYSSGVIGYAVAGPADNPAALTAGVWALPVKSLDSGNKLRDRHIADPDWLDAAKAPEIVFRLKEVKDIKLHKESDTGKSYTCTLTGDMSLRGVTRPLSIPNTTIAFAAANDKAPIRGDLMAIRCKYTILLSDFGVKNDFTQTLKSVADEIAIDQSLMLSRIPPEQQPTPEATPSEPPPGK